MFYLKPSRKSLSSCLLHLLEPFLNTWKAPTGIEQRKVASVAACRRTQTSQSSPQHRPTPEHARGSCPNVAGKPGYDRAETHDDIGDGRQPSDRFSLVLEPTTRLIAKRTFT
jgi:hypothetical protein